MPRKSRQPVQGTRCPQNNEQHHPPDTSHHDKAPDEDRTRAAWASLPIEILVQIVRFLTSLECGHIAKYATICRSWQPVIEEVNFKYVVMNEDDVPGLEGVLSSRKGLIRHICLHIQLNKHGIQDVKHVIWVAVFGLLCHLTSWREEECHPGGLTLELNTEIPWVDGRRYGGLRQDAAVSHNASRSPGPYSMTPVPTNSQLRQLFGPPIFLGLVRTMPQVTVIRKILIRRQSRRLLDIRGVIQLAGRCRNLESLHYEPWRRLSSSSQDFQDFTMVTIFQNQLVPETLRTLTLFEEFNEDYDWGVESGRRVTHQLVRQPSTGLGGALVQFSTQLEHLSVSYAADASDFFQTACSRVSDACWPRLKTLAMTAQLLRPVSMQHRSARLLRLAATGAHKMPKLQTMELWYGRRHECGIFRYDTAGGCSTIHAAATWNLVLEDSVVQAWATVAGEVMRQELRVEMPRRLSMRNVQSHSYTLSRLRLVANVVHPVSLRQMMREGLYSSPCAICPLPAAQANMMEGEDESEEEEGDVTAEEDGDQTDEESFEEDDLEEDDHEDTGSEA